MEMENYFKVDNTYTYLQISLIESSSSSAVFKFKKTRSIQYRNFTQNTVFPDDCSLHHFCTKILKVISLFLVT